MFHYLDFGGIDATPTNAELLQYGSIFPPLGLAPTISLLSFPQILCTGVFVK
jgi:hypothetical protein